MPLAKETSIYKKFVISVSLAIILSLAGIFFAIIAKTRQLIDEESITQTRTLFNSIVLARKWNANHGGVYVEKKEGMESNPYLQNPDIKTIDGKVYTLKTPATMTREISEYAEKEGLFKFHITSMNPLNPNNKPDEFEMNALSQFEKGKKEIFHNEKINDRIFFRYMAPLYVEKECLPCHLKQGYKLNDVRGGISVTLDVGYIQNKLKRNTLYITAFGSAVLLLLMGLIYLFTARLTKAVSGVQQQLRKMAITDGLTGMFNRKHIMSRFYEEFERAKRLEKSLGCIMIDIDRFKSINDKYGHITGDEVLREIPDRIKNSIRIYDVLGRYGGEEFLVVLPDTNLDDAKSLAERIRENVKLDLPIETDTAYLINVTISLGVTCMLDEDKTVDDIIKRADEGLYKAKASGRDNVMWV